MALEPMSAGWGVDSATASGCPVVLDDFTTAWERGLTPAVEEYLGRLDPADSRAAVELIYREFCLSEADGCTRQASDYLERFPQYKAALERLIRLHAECPPSLLDRWMKTTHSLDSLPRVGDSIGPFDLCRELGRGSFARVFLAEQTDLENRLVVLKVSTRLTREPWLLARVRHANIIEIVSHARVNDGAFQLICMPFWGGATLAAILAARKDTVRRPRSGIDLLADLDSVAAPEFQAVQSTRAARGFLAGLTHAQAVAWIGARLAEALDHACRLDVAHGDVKPSNILLSADANPLLLDFNLARDWSPAGLCDSKIDPGGTLAYMAPERLRDLAMNGPARDDASARAPRAEVVPVRERSSHFGTNTGLRPDDRLRGPHQADIYALGMVLLEALTGQPPAPVAVAVDPAPSTHLDQLKSAAAAYASARSRSAQATLQEAEASGWRTITPGLRAILERCLDPDPGRRYRRGLELAEDLDRWRMDRALICTAEPFWCYTVPRLLRRQRKAIVAAVFSLILIVTTTAIALYKSQQHLLVLALHKIAGFWDAPEARVHRFQKPSDPRLIQADDFHFEIAKRALYEYGLLGTDDWHRRDDVRTLPKADSEDLEVWLMEQVYVYCRVLADRPSSRNDWLRALTLLDHVSVPTPIPAFAALRQSLNTSLGNEGPISHPARTVTAAGERPPWFNEYLLGVVAECDLETEHAGHSATDVVRDTRARNRGAAVRDLNDRTRRAAERALDHYNKFLASHSDSYWGHYRAAAVSFGLGGRPNVDATASHLEKCIRKRPQNAMLHHHLAASLTALGQHREAQHEIEIAILAAPDLAESYRTRARIRTTLGETGGLADDLNRFELLGRFLPRTFLGQGFAESGLSLGRSVARILPFPSPIDFGIGNGDRPSQPGGERGIAEVDPAELVDRADLASKIRDAGEPELAQAEFGKLLMLNPDDIGARITRAMQAVEAGRLDVAFPDIEAVINHPGLAEYLRNETVLLSRAGESKHYSLIRILGDRTRNYCYIGRVEEGRAIARRALDLAIALRQPTGGAHYELARAFVVSDKAVGKDIGMAAKHLYRTFVAHPLYRQKYIDDTKFNAARVELDAILDSMPDPTAEYHRRLRAQSSPKGG